MSERENYRLALGVVCAVTVVDRYHQKLNVSLLNFPDLGVWRELVSLDIGLSLRVQSMGQRGPPG